jgi:NTE family protein
MPSGSSAGSSLATAVVLTGGGARGAYEAGVLLYVLRELPRVAAVRPRPDIFTGTSVGALNACAIASLADEPAEAAGRLAAYWRGLTMERVVSFGLEQLRRVPEILLGRPLALRSSRSRRHRAPGGAPHPPVGGLFDTRPLREDMSEAILWPRIQDNLRAGTVRGIGLCATQVCTSQAVVFYQVRTGITYRDGLEPTRSDREVVIGLDHAMASAAIPFLFPAVQIGGICYADGALRQNIPLNPAIRLGADRILVVGLSQPPGTRYDSARLGCLRNPFPGAFFLVGRTVNALMDGMLEQQLRRIDATNHLLRAGVGRYGDAFLEGLNAAANTFRASPYRLIRTLHIYPSVDLNELAIETIREVPGDVRLPGALGGAVGALLRSGTVVESELSSFLLFLPAYTRKLVDLGFSDARARREELIAFFGEEREAS